MDLETANRIYPKLRDITKWDFKEYLDAIEKLFLAEGYHKLPDKEVLREKIAKILHSEEQTYHSISGWDILSSAEKESFLRPSDQILALISPEVKEIE